MNKQAASSFLLLFVMLLVFKAAHTQPTYQPAPPVNVSDLSTFYKSQVGSRVIGSKRIQNLQLTQTSDSSGPKTEFKLTYLNRAAPQSLSEANYAQQGTWQYITGTRNTLSCSIVYETTLQLYGLLRFVVDASPGDQLEIVQVVPWEAIRIYMLNLSLPITQDKIPQMLEVGEECEVGLVGTTIYRIINDFTGVQIIKLPVGISIQAKTQNFKYGIAGNALYRYNEDTLQYKQIYTFQPLSKFTIRQMQGRIIVYGSSATANNTLQMNYKIKQIFYIFDDKPGLRPNFTVIKTFEINGFGFQQQYNVEISPQLSKFGFGYTPLTAETSSDVVIVAKSVDYLNKKLVDLEFVDVDAYMQIASQSNGLFDFNDNFLVLRSASLAIEAAYQFVGNKITKFADRSLTGDADIDTCVRVLVDPYYKSTLVALVVHQIADGYLIKQVQYGNYAATRRIEQPPPSTFIKFQIPPGDVSFEGPEWSWFRSDGTQTKVQIFHINEEENGNYQRITSTINFGQTLLASSKNCRLVYEAGSSSFAVLRRDPASGMFTRSDITSSLSGVSDTSDFFISERCDRIAVDGDIYSKTSAAGPYIKTSNTDQNFFWTHMDQNLTYAVGGKTIFRYNHSTNFYDIFYKRPEGLDYFPNTMVASFNNRLVIYTMSADQGSCPCDDGVSLEYQAYIERGGRLNLVGKGALLWDDIPDISLSQNLTKALAQGWISDSFEVKAIHFDYSSLKNVTIFVPLQDTVRIPEYMLFQIYDSFIYIRQLPDPSQSANTSYTSVPNKQFVYFLSQQYLPRQIFHKKIPLQSQAVWERSFIMSKNNRSTLFTESIVTEGPKDFVVVDKNEIDPRQASITEGSTGGMGAFIQDGKVIICSPGCIDCTAGVCTECNTGFAFEANAGICQSCALGCTECDPTDPKKCSDCYNGFFLDASTCTRCDPKCISCEGTPSSCLQCQHGEYFSSGDMCQKCPPHCESCHEDGTLICDACRKGFTMKADGKCIGCSISCSDCDPDDIFSCTSCANGLQLVGSKCEPCPDKCQVCNGNSCQQCIPGFSPNSVGKCVLNCLMPCASCADNQPSVCTACFGTSVLISGKCTIDKECNTTGICTDCGVGLNYYLFEGKCYPCSSIAKIDGCIQCSQANQQLCSLCSGGNFLTVEGSCSQCPESCITCFGQGVCTSCQLGYTLPQSMTEGPCLECLPPCLTCSGTPNYCTSCMAGYTKRAWKCQNDNYVGFTIIFQTATTPNDILAIIDEVVVAILELAGQTTDLEQKKDQVTIFSMEDGSISLSGAFTPSSGTTSAAAAAISSGTVSVGAFTSSPISSTVYSSVQEQKQDEDKKGLIIGVIIGSLVFIVLAVVAFVCIYRYRKNQLGMRVIEANSSIIQEDVTPNEPIHPQMQIAHVNMDGPQKPSNAEFTLEKEIELG